MQKNVRFSIESEQINDQVRIQKYGRFDSAASCVSSFSPNCFSILKLRMVLKLKYGHTRAIRIKNIAKLENSSTHTHYVAVVVVVDRLKTKEF